MGQVSAKLPMRGPWCSLVSLATTSAKLVLATYGGGGDVREIGSDTGGVDDIVEGELVNEGRELEEEGQGLRHIWSAFAFISTSDPRRSGRDLPWPSWDKTHLSDTASGASNNCA